MTMVITTLSLYFVCYTLCYCVVNGQQDFNADQSSETDGGLGSFGTNTGLDNSRFLQFENFLRNLRTSTSAPSSRATTRAPASGDAFNDFQLRNFNSQFRNFGGSRSFGQSSTFDSGEQFRSDDANADSGITRSSSQRTRPQTFADRNDDTNNFDNFGSQFSNFNGFSSQTRQRGSNTAPRSTASRRTSPRTTDDDSGASSFSFFSRNFNNN